MFILAQVSPEAPLSFGTLFVQTIAVTIFIVALAIVAIRYLAPRLNGLRRNKDSKIQVLDFQALDARKAIYIVRIEDKRVAVGVTDHQVTKICDLEDKA
jgi:flagellar biosynthetic protein FliO